MSLRERLREAVARAIGSLAGAAGMAANAGREQGASAPPELEPEEPEEPEPKCQECRRVVSPYWVLDGDRRRCSVCFEQAQMRQAFERLRGDADLRRINARGGEA